MTQTTPPGWYPDPEQPGQQRYWAGDAWTDNRAPAPPTATADGAPERERADERVLGGALLSVVSAIAALSVFMPWRQASYGIIHAHQTGIDRGAQGWLVLLLAVPPLLYGLRTSIAKVSPPWWSLIFPVLLLIAAIWQIQWARSDLSTALEDTDLVGISASVAYGLYVLTGCAAIAIALNAWLAAQRNPKLAPSL